MRSSSGTQHVKRAVRLILMRDWLSQRPMTILDMVERFGVSERTIYRDLDELQAEPLRVPLQCRQLWAVSAVMDSITSITFEQTSS